MTSEQAAVQVARLYEEIGSWPKLSAKTGIPEGTLWNIANGRRKAGRDACEAIRKYLADGPEFIDLVRGAAVPWLRERDRG